jgi:hypothetical protein
MGRIICLFWFSFLLNFKFKFIFVSGGEKLNPFTV